MLTLQTLGKEVTEVTRQVSHSEGLIGGSVGLSEEEQTLMKDTLDCLTRRLGALDSALDRRCDTMRSRMRELTAFQVGIRNQSALYMYATLQYHLSSCFFSDGVAASLYSA